MLLVLKFPELLTCPWEKVKELLGITPIKYGLFLYGGILIRNNNVLFYLIIINYRPECTAMYTRVYILVRNDIRKYLKSLFCNEIQLFLQTKQDLCR